MARLSHADCATPEERARWILHDREEAIALAIRSAVRLALTVEREEIADLARNVYGDEVRASGPDEPMAVGEKIAQAVLRRELK